MTTNSDVLKALIDNREGRRSGSRGWCEVYLDNAKPPHLSETSFRSHLASLSKQGVYRPIDGYAWGEVLVEERAA